MRNFILFHMFFVIGGIFLFLGAGIAAMRIEDWITGALGPVSRPGKWLRRAANILLFGGAAALGIYVYYAIGFPVWAEAGRYWHYQGLFWRRIWRALFG